VFAQGVVTEALNPKTALFFVSFLPQFAQPDRGPVAAQLLALGFATVLLNCSADAVVVTFGDRVGRLLRRRPTLWRRQRLLSGVTLIGLGVYAATGDARG
jgi:threonine/homoserine/homoserine lactone efflux protein